MRNENKAFLFVDDKNQKEFNVRRGFRLFIFVEHECEFWRSRDKNFGQNFSLSNFLNLKLEDFVANFLVNLPKKWPSSHFIVERKTFIKLS